jgi:hypothetical protein
LMLPRAHTRLLVAGCTYRPPPRADTQIDCSLGAGYLRRSWVYKAFFVSYINRA